MNPLEIHTSNHLSTQVGHSLPYKTLGFQSVTALLESFPDVCSLQQRCGTIMVVGRPSEGTAHVLNMVNRQGKKQVILDLLK